MFQDKTLVAEFIRGVYVNSEFYGISENCPQLDFYYNDNQKLEIQTKLAINCVYG